MQKVTIDPSIALIVNINSISFKENRNIYFNAAVNWVGTFEFSVWNSYQKNKPFVVANAIAIVDKLMTLNINPDGQNLPAATYYYEIFSDNNESVIFKGDLVITK